LNECSIAPINGLCSSGTTNHPPKTGSQTTSVGPILNPLLELLSEDPFHPKLRTHRLKGSLSGTMACSASYDLRIVFEMVSHEGASSILLLTVGTHDEVY
jgi:mRNA-degrading endonuclease YafQ of YafQ-DinJ toxin-antitoxin module